VTLNPGEMIVSRSCGGGGFGLPAQRNPERVREQVAEGFVSRARAREVYRVVIDDDGRVVPAETEALRAEVTT
ncbi:MAG: hydantoinase B/oxoprolinase family protein, partial [Rhodospirillaceae bacterium]